MKLPLWMRVANWVRVHILRRTTVWGIIKYAKSGDGFRPQFETRGRVEERTTEWIKKKPRVTP